MPTNASLNGVTKTISYNYNLAGQLKTIIDPAGATINYGFDATGRLNDVTGSSFAGVTTYASNAQYRAWGALKHLDYGNTRVLDATYGPRLQPASFNVPGVMSKTYTYNPDGSLQFSSEQLDHKFDRFYSYDHSARITQAFSGAEARGEGETIARPYKQTYSYDAFSHLTARTSLVWNYTVPATSDAYLNNRRTGWTYDANGNLLNGADGSYSFDAAGRIKEVGSFDPVSSTTRGLDGDGQQLRTVEVAYHKETSSWVTTIQYYMHSTVLGGQVLTELDSAGAKKRTFVYAGGTVLAWQKVMGTSQEVLWEHRDPSNASFRMVDMGGGIWGDPEVEPAELDPTGMNARTHAPFVNEPLREHGGSLLPYGSFVTFGNGLSRSYSVDRIPVPVEYFMSRLESQFQGALGFAEYLGRMSAPRLRNYEVALYNGRLNKDFGLNLNRAIGVALETNSTLIRNWLVNDWSFASTFFLPDRIPSQDTGLVRRQKEHDDVFRKILDQQYACFDTADAEKDKQFDERIGASAWQRLQKVYEGVLPDWNSIGPGGAGAIAKKLAGKAAWGGFIEGIGFSMVWRTWSNSIPLIKEWIKIDAAWWSARVKCTDETNRLVKSLGPRPK